jgi:hypothetical protein
MIFLLALLALTFVPNPPQNPDTQEKTSIRFYVHPKVKPEVLEQMVNIETNPNYFESLSLQELNTMPIGNVSYTVRRSWSARGS